MKMIDITAKLTNEKPALKLAEDKVYFIDDRKNTVLKLMKKMESANLNDPSFIDEILEITLGKKAVKEINEMDLSFSAYQTIMMAVIAGITGESLEAVEERFRESPTGQ